MSRSQTLNQYEAHVSVGQARLARWMNLPVEVQSKGCWVIEDEGDAYLNVGGYGVFLLGHCHPDVVAAASKQLKSLPFSTRMLINEELPAAATALTGIAPQGLDYACFTNSGAEAVELAIKLAVLNDKQRFIGMENGFHGKTLGALSVSGREKYKQPFANHLLPADIIPFNDLQSLEASLQQDSRPAAVFVEPIQAEGGVVMSDDGYLSGVKELCQRYNAMMVVDEIQTGLGRTGQWWAINEADVIPDVLLSGKILGGGVLPVGAVLTTADIYQKLSEDPYLHSSTFAGNPMAMSVVKAIIDVIQRDNLLQTSREMGRQLLDDLKELRSNLDSGLIIDIRGKGLLIGIEFADAMVASQFILNMMENKVIVSHSMNISSVVRIIPPAVMGEYEYQFLKKALIKTITKLNNLEEYTNEEIIVKQNT